MLLGMINYAEFRAWPAARSNGRRSLQAKEADAPAAEEQEGAVDAVVVAALALDFQ